MNADAIRKLYDYNYWAHERVWACAMQLSEEQFARDLHYSVGSIRNQLVHIASVDERWISGLKGIAVPDHLKGEDFPTKDSTRQKWDKVKRFVLDYVYSLDDAALEQTMEFEVRGNLMKHPYWEILTHVVNHGTDHRAQTLAMLHQLGAPTVPQDFVFFLWGFP